MSIIRNIEQNHKMDSKRTCSDFWKNRKNMQSLISQGLAGQINPIFIGYQTADKVKVSGQIFCKKPFQITRNMV